MTRIRLSAISVGILSLGGLLSSAVAAEQPPAAPVASTAVKAAPQMPPGARTIRFEGLEPGGSYEVAVDGVCFEAESGTLINCQRACKAPCEITLVPGSYHVRVSGDTTFAEQVDVTSTTSVVRIQRRPNPGPFMMVAGAAALGAGLWMRAAAPGTCSAGDPSCVQSTRRTGLGLAVGGGLGFLAGLAVTAAVHGTLVPDSHPRAVADEPATPKLSSVSVGRTPKGGVSVGTGFSF